MNCILFSQGAADLSPILQYFLSPFYKYDVTQTWSFLRRWEELSLASALVEALVHSYRGIFRRRSRRPAAESRGVVSSHWSSQDTRRVNSLVQSFTTLARDKRKKMRLPDRPSGSPLWPEFTREILRTLVPLSHSWKWTASLSLT